MSIFPFLWILSLTTTQRIGAVAWKLSRDNIFKGIAVALFLSILVELSTAIITSAQRNTLDETLDVGINCIYSIIVGIVFLLLSRKYIKFRVEKQYKSY